MGEYEREELFAKTRNMTEEELQVLIMALPDNLLIDEYVRRFNRLREMVNGARRELKL